MPLSTRFRGAEEVFDTVAFTLKIACPIVRNFFFFLFACRFLPGEIGQISAPEA
jgi:hypothetical protein